MFQFSLRDKNDKENKHTVPGAGDWLDENICAYMQSRTGEALDYGDRSDFKAHYLKNPRSYWYYIGKYKNVDELKKSDWDKYILAFYFYIEDRYGFGVLKTFIQSIFAGKTPDEAALTVIGKNVSAVESEMNKYYYGK